MSDATQSPRTLAADTPDLPSELVTPGSEPVKEFSVWSAFSLSFSDISPIVGIYAVFAVSLLTAGPAFFWALPLVLVGQLLVTGVFGELVSRWPEQGSVYAWARHLVGPRYGWFTNWAYMWGLTLTLSVLSLSASNYLLAALGIEDPHQSVVTLTAVGLLTVITVVNNVGGSLLKTLLYITLACELLASFGIGTALLFFHRVHPFSTLFETAGSGHGSAWMFGPFFGVIAFAGYSFVGFEAAGSIAEEVREARHALPKAVVLSLAAAGALVIYACLGLVLALPDIGDVMSGNIADPVAATLTTRLGSGMGRLLLVVLAVGFFAASIAVQTAVSRAIWASARHKGLPASTWLSRLSGRENLPRRAIALPAVVAAVMLLISSTQLYSLLLSFANAGFYLSYALPVLGLIWARQRGKWTPGPVTMGRWSAPVTYAAGIWIAAEAINIAWPRALADSWYLNWGLLLMTAFLGIVGVVLCARYVKSPRRVGRS